MRSTRIIALCSAALAATACGQDTQLSRLNDEPEVKWQSPVDNTIISEGKPVILVAKVTDDQTPIDTMSFSLTSDVDGTLYFAESVAGDSLEEDVTFELASELSIGKHAITLVTVDGGSKEADDVLLLEIVPNTAPVIQWVTPQPGAAYEKNSDVRVEVSVVDAEEADQTVIELTWYFDGVLEVNGPATPDANGKAFFTLPAVPKNGPEDPHTIQITAKDPLRAESTTDTWFDSLELDQDRDGHITDRLGGDDCDDFDPTVNSRALEVCDGQDNNCNGLVDDDDPDAVDMEVYYDDVDGDGWGDSATRYESCPLTGGGGYTQAPGDCDDGEVSVNPDAVEVCNDGVDNDCDTTANHCAYSGDEPLAGGDSRLRGTRSSGLAGTGLAAGDLDRDGMDDVVVGAPGVSGGGEVYLVYTPPVGNLDLPSSDVVFGGEGSNHEAGQSAAVGDLTGDGYGDLVVGASGNGAGVVYVETALVSRDLGSGAMVSGESSGDQAGHAVSTGDLTGDGVADLLVGAPGQADAGSGAGAVYLVIGPVAADESLADSFRFEGEAAGDAVGTSAAVAPDVNGDGYDEILLGAPGNDEGGTDAGAGYEVLGDASRYSSSGSQNLASTFAKFEGAAAGALAGTSVVGVGDFNGDGDADMYFGAPGAGAGAGYVWKGPNLAGGEVTLSGAAFSFTGGTSGDQLGASAAPIGDVDGDGFTDFWIGAPGTDLGGSGAGVAYLFYGSFAGGGTWSASADANAWFKGEGGSHKAGASVANGGDVNGDGKADILVGAPGHDTNEGSAYVLFGTGM